MFFRHFISQQHLLQLSSLFMQFACTTTWFIQTWTRPPHTRAIHLSAHGATCDICDAVDQQLHVCLCSAVLAAILTCCVSMNE